MAAELWDAMSLRARITLVAAAVVGFALVGASAGLLATLQHSLVDNQDQLSLGQARRVAEQASNGSLPTTLVLSDDAVAQVVDADGSVLAATAGVAGHGPISSFAPSAEPVLLTLRAVPDDTEIEDYRVWALKADTPSGPVRVFVGTSLESVSEAVATLRNALLVGVPVLVALSILATRALVRRALAPVEDIRAEVAAISANALDRRVPVSSSADEISRLAQTMNDMLDRVQAVNARQLEFVADASHELQSPITAFRTQLEVARTHAEDLDVDRLTSDLLADSDRMERLVKDLLFLARGDASLPDPANQLVDLDALVVEEVARIQPRSAVQFDLTGVSAAPMRGNRSDLVRLVRNVVENAAHYAQSRVAVELALTAGGVRLTVSDDGRGVPPSQAERIFERFVRVEDDRSRSDASTGLGLAIARMITERHRGTIEMDGPGIAGRGACFAIWLPAA